MNPFEYQNPVHVIFGAGSLARVGVEAAKLGHKALVVTHPESPSDLPLARVETALAVAGIGAVPFREVVPNPDISAIAHGIALLRKEGCDFVIGLGGGSAMDSAKAIAAGAVYAGGDLWNMVYSRHSDVARTKSPTGALPKLMIPTLPATGSEMNNCAVVSNRAIGEKSYIWSPFLYPQVSILDPELTYTLPPFQTACGGVDTISHVLEIYINGQDRSDLLHDWQEGVMRTVVKNLPVALADPRNAEARAELMWAATCGLNGWASPGDAWTPMHQVGHVLTSRHKVNHGSSLALVMPAWMDFYKGLKPARYAAFAVNVMKVDSAGKSEAAVADEGIVAFRSFIARCGLPTRLSEKGITAADLPAIVEGVRKVSFNEKGVLQSNPPVSAADLLAILQKAL